RKAPRSDWLARLRPGPSSSVTRAPRAAAAREMTRPVRPLEKLLMCRTASIITHVGPAVTRTERPSRVREPASRFTRCIKLREPFSPEDVCGFDLLRFLLLVGEPRPHRRGFS